ncbi:hypothetical protein [Glycomyces xiaoerkulensis]|uniref:hypothetical protein n=1 Tax=Glycomyces xiaoerkulensis TaxID=2038139 RepID=UPI0012FFEB1C|nr:hypothetical protein [Glycomyces xiaoerkulensis]
MPFLAVAALNLFVLRSFIVGDRGFRTLPISEPAAQDLFSRARSRVLLEALFIVRRRR